MELKNVFIDAEKSLGNITFAGAGRESQQRINGGRHAVISELTVPVFGCIQRADNVEVIIPGKAGVKHFEYEEPVALINPHVELGGYAINDRGYVNYTLYADDIVSMSDLADMTAKQQDSK